MVYFSLHSSSNALVDVYCFKYIAWLLIGTSQTIEDVAVSHTCAPSPVATITVVPYQKSTPFSFECVNLIECTLSRVCSAQIMIEPSSIEVINLFSLAHAPNTLL